MPYLVGYPTPYDYGAVGNGVADDTAAVQNAVTAASGAGGTVYFPPGDFLITPGAVTSGVGITMTGVSAGYQGVRLAGASNQASTLVKNGNGVLLQMSGPSSSPSTGSTHCRYCSVEDLGFNGNNFTGAMIQAYYADNLLLRDVYCNNNGDIVVDAVEFWDSRLFNCVFGGSGSTTANASTPNIYLRNSSASSGFGNSTGTTNDIVIDACRFEAFLTGALWIAQGTGSVSGPNTILVTNCKMETSQLNGGSHLSVDANTRGVYVDGLYAYSGGFFSGYSTATTVIAWSGQNSALTNVLISNGSSATVSNGVSVNSTVAGQNAVVRNVTGTYTTAPTGNHIAIGTSTGGFVIDNDHSSATDPSPINSILDVLGSASTTNVLGLSVGGDSVHRFVSNANGGFSWGSGTATADVVAARVAAGVYGLTTGSLLIGATDLGDGGAGVLKLANATTIPTANPTGGAVIYARGGGLITRDPSGDILPLVAGPESSATTGALAESVPRTQVSTSSAFTSGNLLIQSIYLPAGISVGHIGFGTVGVGGTQTHWWTALLDNTYKQQAHSADQTSAGIGASTWFNLAMVTPFVTTYSGTYYLGLMIASSSVPTILQGGSVPLVQFWTGTSHPTPVPNGVSSTGLTTPGTDGTTTYTAPTVNSAPYYMYAAV